MRYYFYKTTNNVNGKYYYGVHGSCTKTGKDSYFGSGTVLRKAIDRYGKCNFSKEILVEFDTLEEAYDYEASHVTVVEVEDPNCYNVQVGGRGGSSGLVWMHRCLNSEGKEIKVLPEQVFLFEKKGWSRGRLCTSVCRIHGKTLTEEHRHNISKAKKGKPSALQGTHISEEHKLKISKARKGRSNYWSLGKARSEETKEKIRQAHLGKKRPQWVIDKVKATKKLRPQLSGTKGKVTVWQSGHRTYIRVNEIQSFLDKGYFRTKKESLTDAK